MDSREVQSTTVTEVSPSCDTFRSGGGGSGQAGAVVGKEGGGGGDEGVSFKLQVERV